MACHAGPCGEAAEVRGLASLTLRGRRPPPAPPAWKRKAQPLPPERGHRCPLPPKAPHRGNPAERATRDRPRGALAESVEQ